MHGTLFEVARFQMQPEWPVYFQEHFVVLYLGCVRVMKL